MSSDFLRVFVYGTLKRGQRNHLRYCSKAVAIETASVTGRLFFLPAGYPMLQVPPESILALGTNNAAADLATQLLKNQAAEQLPPAASDHWDAIEGELISFASDPPALQRLDYLEDYRPGESRSTYLRALVPLLGTSTAAWTYVAPNGQLPADGRRIGTIWP